MSKINRINVIPVCIFCKRSFSLYGKTHIVVFHTIALLIRTVCKQKTLLGFCPFRLTVKSQKGYAPFAHCTERLAKTLCSNSIRQHTLFEGMPQMPALLHIKLAIFSVQNYHQDNKILYVSIYNFSITSNLTPQK